MNLKSRKFVLGLIISLLIFTIYGQLYKLVSSFVNDITKFEVASVYDEVVPAKVPAKTTERSDLPKDLFNLYVASTRVCEKQGFGSENCRNDLLAIAKKESQFNCSAIGTSGEVGCFQIMAYHNFPYSKDYEKSAQWTLERMVRFGYPQYRTFSIQAHNGIIRNEEGMINYSYAYSVLEHSKTF